MNDIQTDRVFTQQELPGGLPAAGEFENCRFINIDFSNANFGDVKFIDCVFTDCNLSLIKLHRTAFRDVSFKGCKILGLQFGHCSEFGLSFNFDQCNLGHSSFFKTKIRNTSFSHCLLHHADFAECDLTNAVFKQCDLDGASFDNSTLEKADFTTSFNFSIDPEKNKIRKAKFSQSELRGLLHKYQIEIDSTT